MHQILVFMFFISLSAAVPLQDNNNCIESECEQTVSLPLLNEVKATLKADIDVRKLNIVLKKYIQHEIKQGIVDAYSDERTQIMAAVEKTANDSIDNAIYKISDEILKSVEDRFRSLQDNCSKEKQDVPVILTACATTKGGMLSTKLIDFTDVRAVSGIRNVSHIKTSGQFTCEQSGLYQISAFVMSEIQGANLLLLKNNINTLAYGHFPRVAGSYSTSTIVVFAELSENDTIGARIQSTRGRYVTFFGSGQSCLSVQKVK